MNGLKIRMADLHPSALRTARGGLVAPLLRVEDVSKHFGGVAAVAGVSFDITRGDMVGLIGPNGAGKTTMFDLLAGSLTPTRGSIRFEGLPIGGLPPHRRMGIGLGRTFQIPKPFGAMSVLENVMVGAQRQSGEAMLPNWLAPARVAREERLCRDKAMDLLRFVSLAPLASQPARVLSGGQRKLLELARVLMADPKLLLLDEPAAGVNPSLLDIIIDRIEAINARGVSVLLIEHNIEMVSRLCATVYVMAQGRLLAQGSPQAVARDQRVIEAYLGGRGVNAPLLRAQAIVAGYEAGLPIVDGASLDVAAGQILALLGPNGAGKSTFIKAIAGLVPITSGSVMLAEQDMTHLPAHLKLALGMAFVPQTENIFAGMTILDNLRIAGDALPDRRRAPGRMAAMFEAFPDLARQRHLVAGRLSGGQRQMLAVARALMAEPKVLMLDEPSAGLSPKLVGEVMDRLRSIRDDGVAIVLVEQNVRAALGVADRALVLVEGRDRFEGTASQLSAHPDLGALYLGRRDADARGDGSPTA